MGCIQTKRIIVSTNYITHYNNEKLNNHNKLSSNNKFDGNNYPDQKKLILTIK